MTIAVKSNPDESSNTTNGVLNIFNSNSYFKLLVSQENSDLDDIIRKYAKEKDFDIEIESGEAPQACTSDYYRNYINTPKNLSDGISEPSDADRKRKLQLELECLSY